MSQTFEGGPPPLPYSPVVETPQEEAAVQEAAAAPQATEGPVLTQREIDTLRGQQAFSAAGEAINQGAQSVVEGVKKLDQWGSEKIEVAGQKVQEWTAEKIQAGKERVASGKEKVTGFFGRAKEKAAAAVNSALSLPGRLRDFSYRALGATERMGTDLAEQAVATGQEIATATVDSASKFQRKATESYEKVVKGMGDAADTFKRAQAERSIDRKFTPKIDEVLAQIEAIRDGSVAAQLRGNAMEGVRLATQSGSISMAAAALENWKIIERSMAERMAAMLTEAQETHAEYLARHKALQERLGRKPKAAEENPAEEGVAERSQMDPAEAATPAVA